MLKATNGNELYDIIKKVTSKINNNDYNNIKEYGGKV